MMPSVRTLESQVLSDGDQAAPQIDADVICLSNLLFGRHGIRRHREIDELGRGCGDQGYEPPDEIARFGALGLGHTLALGTVWPS